MGKSKGGRERASERGSEGEPKGEEEEDTSIVTRPRLTSLVRKRRSEGERDGVDHLRERNRAFSVPIAV